MALDAFARGASFDPLSPAAPFVLLDDARRGGGWLFRRPTAIFCAERHDQVSKVLAQAEEAAVQGALVAGYLAYDAGAAFEPRLLRSQRVTSGSVLAWFGVFEHCSWIEDVSSCLPSAQLPPAVPQPIWTEHEHADALSRVLEYIAAGDIYQANLTFPAQIALRDPLANYAALRTRQRAGWGGIVWTGAHWLLSCSPELFFVLRDGMLTARPMKGTIARCMEEENLASRLRSDPKERAENLMIVDLLRNDFSRVSRPGSVRVPALFEIETYPTVLQMTSTITARVRENLGIADVLAATFPCGSVTGAPKLRAMEVIAELEPSSRGAYTGSMGFMAPSGAAGFNVMIRTVSIDDGAGIGTIGVGSGIVSDSVASREWAECAGKLAFAGPAPGIARAGAKAISIVDPPQSVVAEGRQT